MRILLITANYAPLIDPNAIRWTAIAEHWAQQGHEVRVMCTARLFLAKQENIQGVGVIRQGAYTLRDFLSDRLGFVRARRGTSDSSTAAPGWMEKLADTLWRRWYWPDGACLWRRPALKAAQKLLKDWQPDAMISVCWPFTAHRIAAAIRQQYPSISWTCDYEDPFAPSEAFQPNYFARFRAKNRAEEERILHQADGLSFTCREALDTYTRFYRDPRLALKSKVIPPLNLMQPLPQIAGDAGQVLRIGYFGAFYHSIREPRQLVQCLEALAPLMAEKGFRTELTLAGPDPLFREAFAPLRDILAIHWMGTLDRSDLEKTMAKQDVLISAGNTTAYHLPSKSVELLASGKPVLHLWQHDADPVLSLYKDQEGVFLYPAEPQAIAQWVLGQVLNRPLYRRQQSLEAFSLPRIAGAYLDTFVLHQHQPESI